MRRRGRAAIEFLCRPEDKGVVAEPVPAKSALPAWYRRLPGRDASEVSATNNGLTAKRCLPFLDAMTTGWIVPLAATVRLEVTNDGRNVVAGWEFDEEMVSNHAAFQLAGNPFEPRPSLKFHNPWTIRTPPGWSCLFVPPLNRPDDVVRVFSGVVDTDTYRSPVNFPFVVTAPDGVHTLEQGTSLVQVIPFRRRDSALRATILTESPADAADRRTIQRTIAARDGWYRRAARAPR